MWRFGGFFIGLLCFFWVLCSPATGMAAAGFETDVDLNITGDCYQPGQNPTICFSVTNNSDGEGIDHLALIFPDSWLLTLSLKDTALQNQSISGNEASFSSSGEGDVIQSGNSWQVCFIVDIPPDATGQQEVLWTLNGTTAGSSDNAIINLAECSSPPNKTVPTMSQWGLFILAMIMALAAIQFIRTREQS